MQTRRISMDLRRSFPHSMRVKLKGYVHLARMIDKCRAVLAGTEGEYIYLLTRGPSTPEKQDYFNKLRDAVDPARTDLTSWADLQDLEEGRTVPKR